MNEKASYADGVPRRDSLGEATVAVALGAFCVAAGVLIGAGPLSDNSFLTHLETGRRITEGLGLPRTDPYTFTAAGQPWVVQSWLASVLYGLLDRLDPAAIVVLHGVLGGVVAGMSWSLTARAGALVGRLMLFVPALTIGASFWIERPYVFGLVLLGVGLLAAEDRLSARWLLPAGWLWVNVHGGWPLGLAALALLAVGRRLDGEDWRREARAVGYLAAGLGFGVVNPYGVRILAFPVELLGRRDQLSSIQEWQAPSFDGPASLSLLVLLGVGILGLRRQASWRAALPLAFFVALACTGVRNLPVAALVLMSAVAPTLEGLGSIDGKTRSRAAGVVAAVGGLLSVLLLAAAAARSPFDLERFPVVALDRLDELDLSPADVRLVTHDYVGNLVGLRYGTALDLDGPYVFIDDRVEVAPAALTEDYATLFRGEAGWDDVLAHYAAEVVLWRVDLPLAELLRRDASWTVVFEDDDWVALAQRRSS